MADAKRAKFIESANKLKQKVILNGPLAIDEATLAKAEQEIARLAGEYIGIIGEDVIELQTEIDRLEETENGQADQLKIIYLIAHNIKGLGGSFDYELITYVGNSLCRYIESLEGVVNPGGINVMKLHVASIKAVIAENLKGDGGEAGGELLDGLNSVILKINEAGAQ